MLAHPPNTRRLPWGSLPLRGVSPASPPTDEHPRLAYVPSSAFLTLATACSSLTLADLFHPAATSRFRAPGGSSPDSAAPPRRWHVPPRRWHRSPVTGCPLTPAFGASTSRFRSEPGSATSAEGLTPQDVRVPSCDSLLRASLSQPWKRRYRSLRSGVGVRCCVCTDRWPAASRSTESALMSYP
jgi:hypothetical protein